MGENQLLQRQSVLIKAMRFPLIMLVLFAHSLTLNEVPQGVGWSIYQFVTEMLSHNLCKIAVCWFFVFSGYFFFFNLNDGEFSFNWLTGKWKKRLRSLVLPYVLWNLIGILAIIVKSFIFSKFGAGEDPQMEWIREGNVLGWLWGSQADYPLWYMRDLVLMSLAAPILYYLLRNVKMGAAVVTVLYLLPVYPQVPGERAICFFTLGAYLGMHKICLLEIARTVKKPFAVVAVLLLLLATVGNEWPCHDWLLRAFYPFGMIAAMNIMDRVIDNGHISRRLIDLSSTVFFVYAAHEIYILGWTKGLCLRLLGDGLAGMSISYFLVPVIVVFVCIVLYQLFKKFTPRTLAFVCGGRAQK